MVHGTSGSALTFARCTRSLIHMKRLRVFQTFVHSVFSRALRARSHGMRDQSPALFTKTSHGIDDRPHSFGRSAHGSLRSPSAHGSSTRSHGSRDLRSRAIHFRGAPTSSRGVAARWSARPEVSHSAAPRRQRAPPHAGWSVWCDTLVPSIDRLICPRTGPDCVACRGTCSAPRVRRRGYRSRVPARGSSRVSRGSRSRVRRLPRSPSDGGAVDGD